MKHRFTALLMTILALGMTATSHAQQSQPLKSRIVALDVENPTETKAQLCLDNLQAMSACRSFIKGFIQGALLTDTAIIQSIEKTEPTFAERAIRTRLGGRVNPAPTALAGFCLPAERTILDLAEETLDHVKDAERNSSELAKRVYESLKVDYPCE